MSDVASKAKKDKTADLPPVGWFGRRILRVLYFIRRTWWIIIIVGFTVLLGLLAGAEYATSRPGFCGSCHNMQTYHASWQEDVHAEHGVICVECHYAPGEQHTFKAKLRGLSQLTSYFSGRFGSSRVRAHVNDDSCTICHPTDEEFLAKPLLFPKSESLETAGKHIDPPHSLRPFSHAEHLGQLPNGQELRCATCHEHRAGEKHMATYEGTCYLCHFNKREFNTEEARCLLCHELPSKAIQRDGKSPITHAKLRDSGVNCSACHADTTWGGGPVYKERCHSCHDDATKLAKWNTVPPHDHDEDNPADECPDCLKAKKAEILLHETHAKTQVANCLDCHIEMKHGTPDNPLELARSQCADCHHDAHGETVGLLTGKIEINKEQVELTTFDMMGIHTTCVGCHTEKRADKKCNVYLGAGNKGCQSCHGEDHAVLDSWRTKLAMFQKEALALQKEANEAFKKAEADGKFDAEKLKQFKDELRKADSHLSFVMQAGALHNQKTAGELLDKAMVIYEDVIDAIKKENGS